MRDRLSVRPAKSSRGRQGVLPSADARGGGGRLRPILCYLAFLPRETSSFLRLLIGTATGRLWCWNVEDAEEVTADNVSLITEVVLLKFKLDLSRFSRARPKTGSPWAALVCVAQRTSNIRSGCVGPSSGQMATQSNPSGSDSVSAEPTTKKKKRKKKNA